MTKDDDKVMRHVRDAIKAMESALSNLALRECGDPVVCIAEGRLMSALDTAKEALASLADVLE